MNICTCNQKYQTNSIFLNANLYDPTKTLTLRNQFVSKVNKKFRILKQIIVKAIIEYDILALNKLQTLELTPEEAIAKITARQYEFLRSPQKVERFMEWLKTLEGQGILEMYLRPGTLRGIEEAWTDVFIQTAYQKGIVRARQELIKQGINIPTFEETRDVTSYVFNSPIHAERMGLLFTRTFNEMKGVTDAMNQQLARVLAEGMAEGLGPEEIANNIVDRVDNIGIARARLIARTEIIRAHHQANIQEYRQAGVEGVQIIAEWSTRRTMDVCPECQALEGQYFTLDAIEPMLPAHPNCRCIAIPVLQEFVPKEATVYS